MAVEVEVAPGTSVAVAVGSGVTGVAVGFFVDVAAGGEVAPGVASGVGIGVAVKAIGGKNR